MAVQIRNNLVLTDKVTGVTSGNEPIWKVALDDNIVIQGVLTSGSGVAKSYSSNDDSVIPEDFSILSAVTEE